jgi:hypothetical protein
MKEGIILSSHSEQLDEIKKKIRSLKKLEIKIRFGGAFHAVNSYNGYHGEHQNPVLVWESFFRVEGGVRGKAKYSLEDIASMSKEEYRNVIDEFFFRVYYKFYTECGITGSHLYDPELLNWMGLPADAGSEEIKKKFRELAKKFHPDIGGNEDKFIELMENYHKLVE